MAQARKQKKLGPQLTERLSNSVSERYDLANVQCFYFTQKDVIYSAHDDLHFFFWFFHVSFLHHNLRLLSKSRGPLYVMFHAPFVMCILVFVEVNFSYEVFVSRTFPWYVSSLVVSSY